MNHGPITVRVADPCTVNGRRYPRTKRFETLREAERYAARANHYGLGAAIDPGPALVKRLAEIERENRRAEASRRKCPSCGCTALNRCLLDLGGGDLASCAAAGELPGHMTCSACLTPEKRITPAALFARALEPTGDRP
jgi:hypothetical protein